MNTYRFDEINLGEKEYREAFQVTVSQAMVDSFRAMTGDDNPMHTDPDFAMGQGYGGILVYGLLVASFYSRLAGMYLPGKYCILYEVNTRFHAPVYIGDTLTVEGYIKKKSEVGRTLAIRAKITNRGGVIVNTAKILAGDNG